MGRESPNFLSGEPPQMMPDLPPMLNPHPLATGPDPIMAARMGNMASLNPFMALQQGGINGLAAHYLQNKASFGGLFTGYMFPHHHGAPMMPHGFPGMPPVVTSGSCLSPPTPETIMASRMFSHVHLDSRGSGPPESLDMRKSSIDALRMKAREHSVSLEHGLVPHQPSNPRDSPIVQS